MADLIRDMIQEELTNHEHICPICGNRVTSAAGCAYYYSRYYSQVSAVYHVSCLENEYNVKLPIDVLTNGGF